MTPATARKVDLVLGELRARQERGEITEGFWGVPVSTETMARISEEIGEPVSEKTFRNIETRARRKLQAHPLARVILNSLVSRRTSKQP